ncbi:ABC transporter ATP-binding protein [Paenibacillus elgii]|uniref:ABC transporter ATP-binding protein n=1 Tax=Paenibacillus elgii TaxID=189691 RepID=A0A163UQ06_9BACL|nr:ABC transporter ATP-binding protein [Paenibacillus elgii]KZE73663.1 bacitracin ABC transporter ATP-binding protein [Paenibacillus elgii]NEN80874.1 ABC transporter ATP-binding protein [Paenibacillus elgii]PUA39378.1 ABC transporter ATP-binding protein [Paenibacillus elgii]
MSEFILETKRLSKQFKSFAAVKGVDLQVRPGEVYGFLGPNGAGKTTTIRMLLGLIRPTQGEVRVFGQDLARHRLDILRRVGSLVESPSYYGNLSAYDNLEITRKLLGARKTDIDKVLETVRLSDWRNKKVKTFSLGMKQRLGIAQALLGNPMLLVLDEPTNGLDPAGILEIRELIARLPEERGLSVLVSSHILNEIELIASRVGIIYKGELLFQGSLQELREQNKTMLRIDAAPLVEAGNFLLARGHQVEKRHNSLYVDMSATSAARLNRELVTAGFDVSHVSENTPSLEDIFLTMTKGAQSL